MVNGSVKSLPDKLYFRIGEVSDIVAVKPYVLRYWETEFGDIKPTKSKSGQRLYKKRDVELLLKIKELLYAEGFTISGAKQRLKELQKVPALPVQQELLAVEEKPAKAVVQEKAEAEVKVKTEIKSEVVSTSADRKFLQKIKSDLEWCLSELRS